MPSYLGRGPISDGRIVKVVIGTPNFTGDMCSDVAVRMAKCIRKWSEKHEVHWLVLKRTFVCKARHMIAKEAVRLGADYLFWIDDDAIVGDDFLDRLISHDKEIVITPYPLRTPPHLCGVLRSKTGDFEDQGSYYNLDWETDLNKGLVEVDGGGTHAMLTKVSVYGPEMLKDETIAEYNKRNPGKVPFPWFVLAPLGGTEDMWFCLIAKRHGFKIYCDTDIQAMHVGYTQILSKGNYLSWNRKYGKKGLAEVMGELPEGSTYLDVGDVAS